MKKSFLAILMLPFFLVGCSSTFAYNNLDWLLYWYIDDYVELDKTQKKIFDGKLDVWLKWHRQEELVQYQSQLLTLKERLNVGPMNAEQWKNEFDAGRSHWVRLRNRVGPELVTFSVRLNDRQVEDLFEALEKENLENEEERAESTERERQEERIENIQDQLKGYIGKLSEAQKDLIADYEPRFKTNFENWITYRRSIQSKAKQLMLNRQTNPDYSTQLIQLMTHPETYQSQEYKDVSEHNRNLFATLVAELNAGFSAKQMRKINKKIDSLLEDIDDLIND